MKLNNGTFTTVHFVFHCLPYIVLLGTFMSLAGYKDEGSRLGAKLIVFASVLHILRCMPSLPRESIPTL